MATNSRRKGNRRELEAVRELEAQGYLVYRVKGSTMFNDSVDIFGLFDLLCIKKNETKLIQVKSNIFPKIDEFIKFQQKYPQFKVEVWMKKDYEKNFNIRKCGEESA